MTGEAARVVVIGLGNEDRGDDGIGPVVARASAEAAGLPPDPGPPADPTDLLDRWEGAALAVVVDAVRAGDPPGTLRVVDTALPGCLPDTATRSTHGLGLDYAVRLSRAVHRLPERVVLVGVEGRDFSPGAGLSCEVAAVVPAAVTAVLDVMTSWKEQRCV